MNTAEIAEKTVRLAVKLGAAQASVLAASHLAKTVEVYNQQLQAASEAATTRLVIRIFQDDRGAVVDGQCSSEEMIEGLVKQAMAEVSHTSPDKLLGLPDPKEMGKADRDLGIFDRRLAEITPAGLEEIALRAESVIRNAWGSREVAIVCRALASDDVSALCTSEGFKESYPAARLTLTATAIGNDPATGILPNGNGATGPLSSNRTVARVATSVRAIEDLNYDRIARRLTREATGNNGARPSPSGWFPVVFTSSAAQTMARFILQPLTGRIASFIPFTEEKIGDAYCSAAVTMVDDGTEIRGFRTAPFDEEGVRTRATVLVEKGVMTSYLLNSYYGRVMEHASTGNAGASVDPRFNVVPTNAYIRPGDASPEDFVADIKQGLYATSFLSGVDVIDTNFTQAASGFWIENGRLTHPIRAAAVSSPRLAMLKNIVAVGNDPEQQGPITTPSLMVSKMNVSSMV